MKIFFMLILATASKMQLSIPFDMHFVQSFHRIGFVMHFNDDYYYYYCKIFNDSRWWYGGERRIKAILNWFKCVHVKSIDLYLNFSYISKIKSKMLMNQHGVLRANFCLLFWWKSIAYILFIFLFFAWVKKKNSGSHFPFMCSAVYSV